MATHSNILAWRIPWTEEPGGLQSTGLIFIYFLIKINYLCIIFYFFVFYKFYFLFYNKILSFYNKNDFECFLFFIRTTKSPISQTTV